MDTVSRATGVPLQDGVEGLTVQPPPPPGGSHDLDRAEGPIAEGQGLRRRVGRPRRPRRRLPPRLALQVGGPRLHAHHAARARRRGPVPDQPVRRLLRRDHGLQPGEDRPQGPEDRPLALRGESGRLRDPQRDPRLVADLGDKTSLILRNHGLLTVGETVADAWVAMYYLEASCAIQVRAQAGGELIPVPKDVLEQAVSRQRQGARVWPGLLRRLERVDPSYKS